MGAEIFYGRDRHVGRNPVIVAPEANPINEWIDHDQIILCSGSRESRGDDIGICLTSFEPLQSGHQRKRP